MRVLWVCNIMLPAYAAKKGLPFSEREGWLSGAYEHITTRKGRDAITLGVCFPAAADSEEVIDGVSFYGFREDLSTPEVYDSRLEERFSQIVQSFQPDLLHVYGTEFPHALAALRVFEQKERSLLTIQGLCGPIAEHYMAGLPQEVQDGRTFRDRVRADSLQDQRRKFFKRAEHEAEAIRLAGHIAGRTLFDKEETARMNPEAVYHTVRETLRDCFYKGERDASAADAHSLFLSQGDYPLKGFHDVLRALPEVIREYPDTHLYVAGNSLIGGGGYGGFVPLPLRISGYGRYLKRLIAELHLQPHVTMLGSLNAEQMKARYCKSGAYLCASHIENSPNSLGEAMILGLPCVATSTGGIPSMIEDQKEGLLFGPGDAGALAEAVKQIFSEKVIALVYADNARKRALITHDPQENRKALLAVYRAMTGEGDA